MYSLFSKNYSKSNPANMRSQSCKNEVTAHGEIVCNVNNKRYNVKSNTLYFYKLGLNQIIWKPQIRFCHDILRTKL